MRTSTVSSYIKVLRSIRDLIRDIESDIESSSTSTDTLGCELNIDSELDEGQQQSISERPKQPEVLDHATNNIPAFPWFDTDSNNSLKWSSSSNSSLDAYTLDELQHKLKGPVAKTPQVNVQDGGGEKIHIGWAVSPWQEPDSRTGGLLYVVENYWPVPSSTINNSPTAVATDIAGTATANSCELGCEFGCEDYLPDCLGLKLLFSDGEALKERERVLENGGYDGDDESEWMPTINSMGAPVVVSGLDSDGTGDECECTDYRARAPGIGFDFDDMVDGLVG
ncbi:hypothetical protein MKZ38_006762 [Zalerion maritima]|uniref:Uncharacterized protein n=1 Tax=Zalerion maritima TaxID=339359 RepID=A0AAD5RJL2_9PEZI|nr:hypothetical protein MKZ38_006762 [Zalerion maritima]